MALMDEMVRREEIMRACGWRPATATEPERPADTRLLDRVLREHSPMCCYLGDEIAEKWTRLALGPMDDYKAAHDELRARTFIPASSE